MKLEEMRKIVDDYMLADMEMPDDKIAVAYYNLINNNIDKLLNIVQEAKRLRQERLDKDSRTRMDDLLEDLER